MRILLTQRIFFKFEEMAGKLFFLFNIGNINFYKINTMEMKKNVQMMIRESFDVIILFNQRLQPFS